jgi:allantoate deiminase
MPDAGRQLSAMLVELGTISDEPPALTRTFLSPAMRAATERVAAWMRKTGLSVRHDSVGNVIGRLEASARGASPRKTLLLGSHLDTVRNAGRFDGPLGVLAPLVALQVLRQRGVTLPFAVEVLGFSEEEGVRFASAYLGSKGFTGQLRAGDLKRRDSDGISIGEALIKFNHSRFTLPKPAHRGRELLGYCEVHIEQGPVLEAEKLPLGVVSAIAGQTRGRLTFRGQAGHAGTTPMRLRRDALAAAAELILAAEKYARQATGLVATVGTIAVPGGAPNVIPGEVVCSLDVRHASDARRRRALRDLLRSAQSAAAKRGAGVRWEVTQDNGAVACSPALSRVLEQSVAEIQGRSLRLVSGAGHDAVVVSALCPVAMLFVRCRKGLSHHPDEYASPADLRAAVEALVEFLLRLGRQSAA